MSFDDLAFGHHAVVMGNRRAVAQHRQAVADPQLIEFVAEIRIAVMP